MFIYVGGVARQKCFSLILESYRKLLAENHSKTRVESTSERGEKSFQLNKLFASRHAPVDHRHDTINLFVHQKFIQKLREQFPSQNSSRCSACEAISRAGAVIKVCDSASPFIALSSGFRFSKHKQAEN